VVWLITRDGGFHGLLMLEATAGLGTPASTSSVAGHDTGERTTRAQPDGAVWEFTSYGITAQERSDLADRVAPGSGVPFVLPDLDGELLAFGFAEMGDQREQTFDGPIGTLDLTVGTYRGEFAEASGASDVELVTVAGASGYQITTDVCTIVLWPAANGQWAALRIPAAYGARTGGIIASIAPAPVPD